MFEYVRTYLNRKKETFLYPVNYFSKYSEKINEVLIRSLEIRNRIKAYTH